MSDIEQAMERVEKAIGDLLELRMDLVMLKYKISEEQRIENRARRF